MRTLWLGSFMKNEPLVPRGLVTEPSMVKCGRTRAQESSTTLSPSILSSHPETTNWIPSFCWHTNPIISWVGLNGQLIWVRWVQIPRLESHLCTSSTICQAQAHFSYSADRDVIFGHDRTIYGRHGLNYIIVISNQSLQCLSYYLLSCSDEK